MHKTLYVDVDEEITSIIDRIRLEEAQEVFLVVPKQAMLTQGVINLKILKKEIEKIGKSVMIATSDVHARKVIERLGIKTKEMTRELEVPKQKIEKREIEEEKEEALSKKAADEAVEKIEETQKVEKKKMADIGSESFFDGAVAGASEQESLSTEMEEKNSSVETEVLKKEQSVPVSFPQSPKANMFGQEELRRDLYAKKLSGEGADPQKQKLEKQMPNSSFAMAPSMGQTKTPTSSMGRPRISNQQMPGQRVSNEQFGGQTNNRRIPISDKDLKRKDLFGNVVQQDYQIKPSRGLGFGKRLSNEKAERFFSGQGAPADSREEILEKEKKQIKREIKKEKGKISLFWKWVVPTMIVVFGLGGALFWGYSNYPKVTVSIYPKQEDLSKEIKIAVEEVANIDSEEGKIPGSFVELEIEKTMNFDATGEAFESDDGKARGKVKIYNLFSSSEQPLIKTTRILSKEGELFRLTSDVVVPGMSGDEPGVVEAGVIADKPGEESNIPPSTFTIEGFKGNPKYEKFEVRSEVAMTNGGNPDSNKKMTVVTAGDLEKARVTTAEALEKSLESEIAAQLTENQQTMVDSVEKEIVSANASHKVDEVANQFSYTIKQKIKAMTFDPRDVNDVAVKTLETQVKEGYVLDSATEVTFKKGIADFEAKTMTMYVNAHAVAWPVLEKEKIAEGIAGKKEQDIKTFLANYPQVEKVEISIVPSWLTTIPVSKDKIKVEEKRSQ